MKKIILFLFEGVELFEVSAFTDIFGWNSIVGSRNIFLETVSYKEFVKCTWGGELKVDRVINETNQEEFFSYDALIIPGGFGKANFFKDKNNLFFYKLVENFLEKDKYILSICSATLNLLSTNLIKNKNLTTYLLDNKRYFNQLKNYDVNPIEKEICVDNKLISCSGAGNSIDLAFILLEIFTDIENVKIVKKNMFL